MLITFVVAYMAVTIAIGLLAARRVHGAKDYLVAGRSLPLYMNVATVFATWFGAETVLSSIVALVDRAVAERPRRPPGGRRSSRRARGGRLRRPGALLGHHSRRRRWPMTLHWWALTGAHAPAARRGQRS